MKRVCYEVKTSRADFLCEMKQPLKRRIGLRYLNESYFETPAGLLITSEIPIECGLVEVRLFTDDDRQSVFASTDGFIHFDVDQHAHCRITVPAPWRETPGPTWQFVAGMLRNQQKSVRDAPMKQPINNGFRLSIDLRRCPEGGPSGILPFAENCLSSRRTPSVPGMS
jgi:hypothetical protein